jgi:membrane-associated phospholipid phosphatase
LKSLILPLLALLSGGCVGHGHWGEAAGFFAGDRLSQAAVNAAKAPQTWVPLTAAGLLLATDVDQQWSEKLHEKQPLFGDDARSVSNDLRDVASGAYVLTALLAPSPTWEAKAKGFAVGASTALLDGAINHTLKVAIGRERPDGKRDSSMPSGHASKAASRAMLARYNMRYMDMPGWSRHLADWTLHGVAVCTSLARVEAGKHHLSDVLVGYAIGNFVAAFMHEAFFTGGGGGVRVSFLPVPEGGAFSLTVPL